MKNNLSFKKLVVNSENVNLRIDNFLVAKLQHSKSYVNKLIANKQVFINEELATKNGYKLSNNDVVKIYPFINSQVNNVETNKEVNLNFNELEIIYDDEYFLVINKPNNLLVYPTKFNESITLSHYLKSYFNVHDIHDFDDDIRKGIIHRLDRQTSGLILVAKSKLVYDKLTNLMSNQQITKKYTCLVHNCFSNLDVDLRIETLIGRNSQDIYKMQVNSKKDAKNAITILHILKNIANTHALVECELITGRTHQARVHMRFINHPILNDPLYGVEKECTSYGQYLYCSNISFIHPFKHNKINLSLPLPNEFILKINELENV